MASPFVPPSAIDPSQFLFDDNEDSISMLSDVPEEDSFTPTSTGPSSPFVTSVNLGSASTSSLNSPNPGASSGGARSKKPASLRTLGRGSTDSMSMKRSASSTSAVTVKDKEGAAKGSKILVNGTSPPSVRPRTTPRLPHDKEAMPAPATLMYWSRAPVYGVLPSRSMRAHSVTLVGDVAWLFGGCDDKDCWKDVYCFDIETMQWSHPETIGDVPPPCRAHTATLVDRKLVIFGGGRGTLYYNDVYVLDTITHRWTRPKFTTPIPAERRAHTAVFYKGKMWIFGGGNGLTALNDVWTLDLADRKMKWEEVETSARKPGPRGYHTANLVGNIMVVIGGSDGKECFSDVWCLNLDTLIWTRAGMSVIHRRLSHSSTQVGSCLFVIGGHDGNDYTSETLLLNLVSLQYETRPIHGKPPSPRGYHVTILADSRIFVFGGFNGHMVFDDVHILDLAGAAYLPQVTSFSIDL